MDQVRTEQLEAEAAKLGKEAGKAAASWYFDETADANTYRVVLQGLEEGDPEIMDTLPSGWLSGEWAGDPTPDSLMRDLGVEPYTADYDATVDYMCRVYEQAADEASYEAIERRARARTRRGPAARRGVA